jgi:hypothetical protein
LVTVNHRDYMFEREELIRRAGSIVRNIITMLGIIVLCQLYVPVKRLIAGETYTLEEFLITLNLSTYFPIVLAISVIVSRRRRRSGSR